MTPTDAFLHARDSLVERREDYEAAYREFTWPALERFNWALDYFDPYAARNDRTALWIVEEAGGEMRLSFAELSHRSNRLANSLRRLGVRRGDRILLMLPNIAPLWEVMLAAMKLGAVIIPATKLLTLEDLHDRLRRGAVRHLITDGEGAERCAGLQGDFTRIVVGARVGGWTSYDDALAAPAAFAPEGESRSEDPFLLYFTSGTTARSKPVFHSHQSYPVGHLSTLYWIGLREDDVHLNISSPGWGKHAWSSFFAPWNAGATVVVHNYARFSGRRMLEQMIRCGVTTLCAPPTVWRLLIQEDLASYPARLRAAVSAGEPLNPEVIAQVQRSWGITIRDGYGQTETTAVVGNTPGQPVRPGSMGRPLPGYRVALLDAEGREGDEGEIALRLDPRPLGLMLGYHDDPGRMATVMAGGVYRTGDIAYRDADGYLWYLGRADDLFKSADYRISPFELESVLLEHAAVAESAVVPSPDPIRSAVPKAYIVPSAGVAPSRALAREIFGFLQDRLAPYQRIRRLEFADLPKTISGKIRRVELRRQEEGRSAAGQRGEWEFWEEQFPELRRG